MDDRGLRHKDLAGLVGNKGLTPEILAGRREISKAVARKLAERLRVPVELLSELRRAARYKAGEKYYQSGDGKV